jgi:SAM-dependent methyltransferase
MDERYEEKYHSLEASHWWFLGRRDMIGRLMEGADRKTKILDLGCAGGSTITYLRGKGFSDIFGIDVSRTAVESCKEKGILDVSLMDARKLDFPDGSFERIIASDVFEHIDDDALALKNCFKALKPGGKLIAFVPAFSFLWSEHDVLNMHFRRYSKRGFLSALKSAGFEIEKSSYWNFSLFFPSVVLRLIQRLMRSKGGADELRQMHPLLNKMLALLLSAENLLIRYIPAPIGLSVLVVAKKPS